jgi:hypothetical protein
VTQGILSKKGDQMTCVWQTYGKLSNHGEVMYQMLIDPELQEFRII